MLSKLTKLNQESATAKPAADSARVTIQRSLKVGSVNDPQEHEADFMADKVMRMHETSLVQRRCAACEKEEKNINRKPLSSQITPFLQAKGGGVETAGEAVSDQILSSKGNGSPIPEETKSFMETRFGSDFSNVRIHTGEPAVQMSRELNAQAFTAGSDIYFNSGKFSPNSSEGKQLLAHELTHTIQQGAVGPAKAQQMVQKQAAAPVPRRTIWVNIGFDSSAQANVETMTKLRASIAVERAALASCCSAHTQGCNIDLRTHHDWVRYNKPAPADGDYDSDNAADRTLRDTNLSRIEAPHGGVKVLVTESSLSQTWQGARIFPRANTPAGGVVWNRALAANDTLAHEAGHAAGYTGDAEGGAHSSDPNNLMSPGSVRVASAVPDLNWCQQMAATAV